MREDVFFANFPNQQIFILFHPKDYKIETLSVKEKSFFFFSLKFSMKAICHPTPIITHEKFPQILSDRQPLEHLFHNFSSVADQKIVL